MTNNVIFTGYDYITDMEKMMPASPAQQIIYSDYPAFSALKKQKTGSNLAGFLTLSFLITIIHHF